MPTKLLWTVALGVAFAMTSCNGGSYSGSPNLGTSFSALLPAGMVHRSGREIAALQLRFHPARHDQGGRGLDALLTRRVASWLSHSHNALPCEGECSDGPA